MTRNFQFGNLPAWLIERLRAFLLSRDPKELSGTYVIASSLLLVAIIIGTFAFNIWTSHTQLVADTFEDMRVQAALAESHVKNMLETSRYTLAAVRSAVLSGNYTHLDDLQKERARLLPFQSYVLVLDASGMVTHSTGTGAQGPNDLSGREYFRFHRDNPTDELHVGMPLRSARTNHEIIPLSLRIAGQDGNFKGIVVMGVDIPYLENLYSVLHYKYKGTFALSRDDAILLARSPHVDGASGSLIKNSPLFNEFLPRAPIGEYRRITFIDGTPRFASYRKIENSPLVISINQDESAVMANWYRNSIIYGLVMFALSAVLLWISLNFYGSLAQGLVRSRQLQASEEQLSGIIGSAMDAIITIDEAQNIVMFNSSAETIFGYRSETVIGKSIETLIPAPHRADHRARIAAFGESGVTTRRMGELGVVSGQRADATVFPAEASISQLQSDGKQFFTVILRDVTERTRTEQALAKAHAELELRVRERTAELESSRARLQAYTAAVTHDLRAPVRHINSFAEIALETIMPSDPAGEFLQRIVTAARRMDNIINGLLRLTQTQSSKLKIDRVDLRDLIKSTIHENVPDKFAGELHVDIDALPAVHGDVAQLRQVFANLISNAVKFSAKRERPQIAITCEAGEAGEAVVAVRDNGAGFDMKFADNLFTPLARLHRREDFDGTGIGLSTVKSIVESHNGRVWFDSRPGQGATFYVALRQSDAPAL